MKRLTNREKLALCLYYLALAAFVAYLRHGSWDGRAVLSVSTLTAGGVIGIVMTVFQWRRTSGVLDLR